MYIIIVKQIQFDNSKADDIILNVNFFNPLRVSHYQRGNFKHTVEQHRLLRFFKLFRHSKL